MTGNIQVCERTDKEAPLFVPSVFSFNASHITALSHCHSPFLPHFQLHSATFPPQSTLFQADSLAYLITLWMKVFALYLWSFFLSLSELFYFFSEFFYLFFTHFELQGNKTTVMSCISNSFYRITWLGFLHQETEFLNYCFLCYWLGF